MSSGKIHERINLATLFAIAPFHLQQRPILTGLLSTGWLLGTYLLSPDTDGKSRPIRRWGWMQFVWNDYMKSHGHRPRDWWRLFSSWSYRGHFPVFGSLERLLYLGLRFTAAAMLLGAIAISLVCMTTGATPDLSGVRSLSWVLEWVGAYGLVLWLGIEAACCWHILCDYLPLVRHDFEKW